VNCAGDTIRDQNDRVDPAGTTARQGTFSCEIQAASVSCSDSATGHAFSMSASTFSVS